MERETYKEAYRQDILEKATEMARETIANGSALDKLRQLIRFQGYEEIFTSLLPQ